MITEERGFTLIEVLAAFIVFAVVAVPLTQILLHGSQLASKAARDTKAVNIAQQKMEELLAQGVVGTEDGGAFETTSEGYAGTVDLSPYLGLFLVTVSVTYDSVGTEGLVQLSSLLPGEE